MATYVKASKDVHEFVASVMAKHHHILHSNEVTVDVGFAVPATKDGEKVSDPLKCGGVAVPAIIRVNGQKQRAKGWGTADLTLDPDRWHELTEAQQEALVDQQLTRLQPIRDSQNGLKMTEDNHLALRIRPYDIVIRGFEEVIRRHSADAIEAMAIQEVVIPENRAMRQLVMNFEHEEEHAAAAA